MEDNGGRNKQKNSGITTHAYNIMNFTIQNTNILKWHSDSVDIYVHGEI